MSMTCKYLYDYVLYDELVHMKMALACWIHVMESEKRATLQKELEKRTAMQQAAERRPLLFVSGRLALVGCCA